MKKNKAFSFVVCIMLLSLSLLTACNQPEPTGTAIRWGDEGGKSFVYDISLASFVTSTEADKKIIEDVSYYGDTAIVTAGFDEVRPLAAKGTYTVTVTFAEANYDTLTVEQELFVTYKATNVNVKAFTESLTDADKAVVVPSSDELAALGTIAEGGVVYKSYDKSVVTFKNNSSQEPRSSQRILKGFYIGKTEQLVNDINVKCDYTYENGKAKVKIDKNGVINESELPQSKIIDAAQIMLYSRSLEKKSSSFQANPTVYAYNPVDNQTALVTFTLNRATNLLLKNSTLYGSLNSVSIYVASNILYYVHNCPIDKDFPAADKEASFDGWAGLTDVISTSSGYLARYTVMKFQNGYFSYELRDFPADIAADLKTVPVA